MFMPGFGILTWKDAQNRIPWGTIILFGIGISLGTALLQTNAATWLANIVVAQFGLKDATVLFILGVMSLFLVVIHLGFASATALASAMIPIVIAVLKSVATPGNQHHRHDHGAAIRGQLRLHPGRECAAKHGRLRNRNLQRRATSFAPAL